MKKMVASIVSIFLLSIFSLSFALEQNAVESNTPTVKKTVQKVSKAPKIEALKGTVKGTVTNIKRRFYQDKIVYEVTIQQAKGNEKTVEVTDAEDIEVGDRVVAKGVKVTKVNAKQ